MKVSVCLPDGAQGFSRASCMWDSLQHQHLLVAQGFF